jgi:hypothetical protein
MPTNGVFLEADAYGQAKLPAKAQRLLDRASAMQVGIAITRAQRLVVERDSRVADPVLMDARKKLALLEAGS